MISDHALKIVRASKAARDMRSIDLSALLERMPDLGYVVALALDEENRQTASSSSTSLSLWKWLWSLRIPPEVELFLWKCILSILPVSTNLLRKKFELDPLCRRCGEAPEIIEHCLRDCAWSRFFWAVCPLRFACSTTPPPSGYWRLD